MLTFFSGPVERKISPMPSQSFSQPSSPSFTQGDTLDVGFVRRQFPSLNQAQTQDWIFMDNAGGSQVAQPVIDRLNHYLLTSNVQLGASYGVSQQASDRLSQATQQAAVWLNAADVREIVMGPSTSMLLRILAHCMGQTLQPGDEIIVTNCDHEANITPWRELAHRGVKVKTWRLNPDSLMLETEDLKSLLTDRTRLVALTHASNVLGSLNPIRQIADLVHQTGAMLCVDGVGYAPHRAVDVQAMDVDFYVFSFYKVYGPHHALLYGKRDRLLALPSFNHEFIGSDQVPYKFQPGGANYELTYATLGLVDYVRAIAAHQGYSTAGLRQQILAVFDAIAAYEERLSDRLLSFLTSRPRVRIIGSPHSDRHRRVPTLAFVVDGADSATFPSQIDRHKIGIRYGHFYAKRLIDDLGLAAQNGVVRISLVHYNTLDECDRLIKILEPLL